MPSPIGHALAGLTIAWAAGPPADSTTSADPGGRSTDPSGLRITPLTWACLAAAVLPDLDLVHYPLHRTISHSFGFTLLIMIIAAGVTGWVTGRVRWRAALVVGAAHASHILLDWLGVDRFAPAGIEALWPVSHHWYISGWDVFLPTERRDVLSTRTFAINLRAAVRELAIMGTIAAATWSVRRRRRSRVQSSAQDVPPPPSGAAGDRGDTSDRRGRCAARSE
jgi:membrane-bound metal-dependent hydrolase YbcI (DUF457 family)